MEHKAMFDTYFTNINDRGVPGVLGRRRAKNHRDTATNHQECGRGLIKNSTARSDKVGIMEKRPGFEPYSVLPNGSKFDEKPDSLTLPTVCKRRGNGNTPGNS
jgi:hypothetical protein